MSAHANQDACRSTDFAQQNMLPQHQKSSQYKSIVDSDDETASEDDSKEPPNAADFLSSNVLGVSISRVQTHIADPKTPAAEKAAVLHASGGYFGDAWQTLAPESENDGECKGSVSVTESSIPLPHGPGVGGSAPVVRSEEQELMDVESAFEHQEHATSQSAKSGMLQQPVTSSDENRDSRLQFRKLRASSLPKPPTPSHISTGDGYQRRRVDDDGIAWASEKAAKNNFRASPSVTEKKALTNKSSSPSENTAFQPGYPSVLPFDRQEAARHHQRSHSDDFAALERTKSALSTASSLGDDGRFSHITKQVNSRTKALKDSFQDSNLRMPSISTISLPSISSLRFGFSLNDPDKKTGEERLRISKSFRSSWSSSLGLSTSPSRQARIDKPNRSPERRSVAIAGMSSATASSHPHFTNLLEHLTGDIVILGGYRGSVLKDAKNPERRLWIPFKAGLNLQKVDLEVGLDPEDEETEHQRVIATKMLTHIGPIDISRRLIKRLRASGNAINGKLRVHSWGYDWRLSPHLLSQKFVRFLEHLPSNGPDAEEGKRGALIIAHSLGGLITRHAVNRRPELFSGVLYAGVPQHCVNILGPMRNGDDVIFSQKILTAQVNFTIRTSFALLPLSGRCFVDKVTKEEYPVDFFDVDQWVEYRWSPCIDPPLPPSAPVKSSTFASILPSIPSLHKKLPGLNLLSSKTSFLQKDLAEKTDEAAEAGADRTGMAMQMGGNQSSNPAEHNLPASASASTAVTIPRDRAIAYLRRTLADTKRFLQDLEHQPRLAVSNAYPPFAVMYGKTEPTVCGAKVDGRDGIKRADAYDELAFASGDGVVLARAAQLPDGYKAVRGGVVSTDRGHVTLLTDLEAVGRCLGALVKGRRAGVGLGAYERREGLSHDQ